MKINSSFLLLFTNVLLCVYKKCCNFAPKFLLTPKIVLS